MPNDTNTTRETGRETERETDHTHRAHKCPRCGGEFDSWRELAFAGPDECPFCGLKKGEYTPGERDDD